MLGPALFGPCRYIAASSPLVATLDSLLRSSVIMKTRTWGSTFMYLPSSLSLANESWDLLISPSIFFLGDQPGLKAKAKTESQPGKPPAVCSTGPGLHEVHCTLPATRGKKGPRAQPCMPTQTCLPHVLPPDHANLLASRPTQRRHQKAIY